MRVIVCVRAGEANRDWAESSRCTRGWKRRLRFIIRTGTGWDSGSSFRNVSALALQEPPPAAPAGTSHGRCSPTFPTTARSFPMGPKSPKHPAIPCCRDPPRRRRKGLSGWRSHWNGRWDRQRCNILPCSLWWRSAIFHRCRGGAVTMMAMKTASQPPTTSKLEKENVDEKKKWVIE